MKQTPLVLIVLLSWLGYAQFAEPYVIYNDYATDLKVGKINNDGLLDVVAAYVNDNKVAWYDNTNGNGQFGTEHIITQSLQNPIYIDLTDLNGDGDNDVLVSASTDSKVVWYENLDSQGNFGTENVITSTNFGLDADKVEAADIDNDGDMDVVFALSNENKLVWFENIDGQGNFSSEKIISNNTIGVYEFDIGDIDGDGDVDIICNSSTTGYPSWFENIDGQGNFGIENIIDNISTFKILLADIDNDGDNDLFKKELVNGEVLLHWYENIDGLGNFIQRQLITNQSHIDNIYFTDIDNDDDLDIYSSFGNPGIVAWFENVDGLGTFSDIQIIEDNLFSARGVFGAKIDSDEYNDVVVSTSKSLGGGTYEYKLVWYRNQTYLGIEENPLQAITLTPNPTSGIIAVNNIDEPVKRIIVFDMLGKQIHQQSNTKAIDISNLQKGLYLINIVTAKGSIIKKVIKE